MFLFLIFVLESMTSPRRYPKDSSSSQSRRCVVLSEWNQEMLCHHNQANPSPIPTLRSFWKKSAINFENRIYYWSKLSKFCSWFWNYNYTFSVFTLQIAVPWERKEYLPRSIRWCKLSGKVFNISLSFDQNELCGSVLAIRYKSFPCLNIRGDSYISGFD